MLVRALQKRQHSSDVKSLGSLHRFELFSPSYRGASTHAHLNSNHLVDQSGYSSGQVRVFPINSRAKHRHHICQIAFEVPDCGSREYTIMRIDCGRHAAERARFHFPVHRHHQSSVGNHMCIAGRSFQLGNCTSAGAFSSRRIDMQHRSEGRTGPWLAAGYAMCFRCERNGTTRRLTGTIRHLGVDIDVTRGGTLVLGCFCAKQPDRPRHATRKLRRSPRQRCRRPGSGRQGADWRIPPHDHVAVVIGRRPDRS